jgi:hypothetical protein
VRPRFSWSVHRRRSRALCVGCCEGGAGGARTHDRRIVSSLAWRSGCAACTDTTDPRRHNAHCTHFRQWLGPRTGPRLTAAIASCRSHSVTMLRAATPSIPKLARSGTSSMTRSMAQPSTAAGHRHVVPVTDPCLGHHLPRRLARADWLRRGVSGKISTTRAAGEGNYKGARCPDRQRRPSRSLRI